MAFGIEFEGSDGADHGDAAGRITLGGWSEPFLSPTHYWSRSRYRAHWRDAVAELLASGSPVALITQMHDPAVANWIMWWPMYPVGDRVQVRNQMLIMRDLPMPFDPDDPFRSLPPNEPPEPGEPPPSEWWVQRSDLSSWVGRGSV